VLVNPCATKSAFNLATRCAIMSLKITASAITF
jgi:hypothetical protein